MRHPELLRDAVLLKDNAIHLAQAVTRGDVEDEILLELAAACIMAADRIAVAVQIPLYDASRRDS